MSFNDENKLSARRIYHDAFDFFESYWIVFIWSGNGLFHSASDRKTHLSIVQPFDFFSSRSRIMVKQNTVCFTYHAINQRYHHFNGCLNEKRDYCDKKNIKKIFKRKKVNVELSYLYITNFKVKTRMKYT